MPDLLQKLHWLGVTPELRPADSDAMQFHLDEDFERFQLRSLALQAKRVLVPVLAVSGVIAWLLPRSNFELAGWSLWALVAVLMLARWRYSQHYSRKPTAASEASHFLRRMLLINFAIGVSTGSFCWLGFPGAEPLQHAAITTLLVGLAAGAVATCASSRWAFIAYGVPLFLQLLLAWILFGQVQPEAGGEGLDPHARASLHLVFAAAIGALFWVLLATCNDSERWIRNAFRANLVNRKLVAQLQDINIELHQQRESALAANQAKTRFLAAASHDLRQPLHALSLYSASLSLQVLPERSKQLATAIQDCVGKSLAPLLDALLDVSKLDANLIVPVLECFALETTLRTVRQEIQTRCDAKRLALHWEIPEQCRLTSDARLLIQIIRNLLDNALKYTEDGSVCLQVRMNDGLVFLEVKDTGSGIDAEDLPRVFEEFYQCGNAERDRSKGLGLGLAIVKRLCDLLRIDLAVESQRGIGTSFRLNLGAAEQGLPLHTMAAGESPVQARLGMRVLVIDNELIVRESTRGLLEEWGCEVSVATNAREALVLANDRQFDVLLSDYRLKASETGLEVLCALSEIQPHAHRWLVTGETGTLPWQQLRDQNIKVLHKPLEPKLFLRALAAV
jgi:two-component system, sensor histidine kinase